MSEYFHGRVTFEYVSSKSMKTYTIADILAECDEGDALFGQSTDKVEETKVSREEADKLAVRFGSDEEFFSDRDMFDGEWVTVRFTPEAWQNDQAVPCDPLGPTEFLVKEEDAKDAAGNWFPDNSLEGDRLKSYWNAPPWIRRWQGPFSIAILHDTEPEPE